MNLHEYQAKALLERYGVAIPPGGVARSVDEAHALAISLGAGRCVVKSQIHAGGRGKGGGVRVVEGPDAVAEAARALLGTRLVTPQTGAAGLSVDALRIEPATAIAREFYLALLVDRTAHCLRFVASAEGGMDIERVAAARPDAVLSLPVDPATGVSPWHARRIGQAFGLNGAAHAALPALLAALHRLLLECDASLVEINPLALTDDARLIALDAKIALDDNALFRHPDLAALDDPAQRDPREQEAERHGLNYIALDGGIGCMVNGAGLAMATMDLVRLHGGTPANFLDVGGTATAERVAAAFRLILSDPNVRAILVNIFGGIVRCDLIAEGILAAAREVHIGVPVVVRLEGTNAEEGRALLARSGLDFSVAGDLDAAAQKAVELAA